MPVAPLYSMACSRLLSLGLISISLERGGHMCLERNGHMCHECIGGM